MAVRIRLKRFGAKKQPSYRLVVADSREARTGKFIEAVGYYNPLTEPATIVVDAAKIREWIRKGAQPTDSVRMLLVRAGVWDQVKQVKDGSTPAAGGQAGAGGAEKPAAPSEGATA
ncbi:MAG: 30S ribosomal protein S16 [Limnochordales bacterium]|nr:30S ribosomal protein S16 [Limnochordales bacterium]